MNYLNSSLGQYKIIVIVSYSNDLICFIFHAVVLIPHAASCLISDTQIVNGSGAWLNLPQTLIQD